jgi:putative endonuclease
VTVRASFIVIMYYVYVLKSEKDKKMYYGFTLNLEKRLGQHNCGLVQSTKSRAPFKIVYYEKVPDILTARRKEKYFKSGFGRKHIARKLALSSNG